MVTSLLSIKLGGCNTNAKWRKKRMNITRVKQVAKPDCKG